LQSPPLPLPKPGGAHNSFAECLNAMPNYSIMKKFGDRLGLTKQYQDPNLAWTIFAPTDAAFRKALEKVGLKVEALDRVPLAMLKNMITPFINYHIVPQAVPTKMMFAGEALETKDNKGDAKPLEVAKLASGTVVVTPGFGPSAKIVRPNVRCGAGWAHGIDGLLMPKELPKLPAALTARLG
jgi:uncharacterized surface protein with fasciclin (FAS1) repeats